MKVGRLIIIGAILTTIIWIVATYITPPDDERTLRNFIKKVNPGGPGWKKFYSDKKVKWAVPHGIMSMILGCILVYGLLLGFGYYLYGNTLTSMISFIFAFISALILIKFSK